jgi:hypothetical protein
LREVMVVVIGVVDVDRGELQPLRLATACAM